MKFKASSSVFLPIYALSVCFVMTLVVVLDLGLILNDITGLSVPEWRYASSLYPYSSDEAYSHRAHVKGEGEGESSSSESPPSLTPQALTEKRLRERANFLETTKASDITSLIKELQWLFIVLIFLFLHWRLYEKQRH